MIQETGIDAKPTERVCQGDLLRKVTHIEGFERKDDAITIRQVVFPLVVVLTQDCDLQQDHNGNDDKRLISALVAPAYNATHFIDGNHLSALGRQMQVIPKKKKGGVSTMLKDIMDNKNPRYHFLHFGDDVDVVDSAIDFKHYFSANVEYLNQIKRSEFAGKVAELYREDISQRFASFLGRIGLPNPTDHRGIQRRDAAHFEPSRRG